MDPEIQHSVGYWDATEENNRRMDHEKLTLEEWEAVSAANKLLEALNAPSAIGKVERAQAELIATTRWVFEEDGRAIETQVRVEWELHLDTWLDQFVGVRRRFAWRVSDQLGDAAGGAAEALFKEVYESEPHYRMAWELRNLTEHGAHVLDLTHLHAEMVAPGRVRHAFNLDVPAVLARMRADEARMVASGKRLPSVPASDRLEALWPNAGMVEIGTILGNANTVLQRIMARIWLADEAELTAAADTIDAMAARVSDKPGRATMFSGGVTGDRLEGSMQPVRVELAESIRKTLDESRQIVARTLSENAESGGVGGGLGTEPESG